MTEELLNDIESRLLAHDSYVEDIDALLAEVRRLHLFQAWLERFKAFEADQGPLAPAEADDVSAAQYRAIRADRRILIRQIEDVLAGKWEVPHD